MALYRPAEELYGEGGALDTSKMSADEKEKFWTKLSNMPALFTSQGTKNPYNTNDFLTWRVGFENTNSTPSSPTPPPPSYSGGYINYAPQRQAYKSSIERTAPTAFQGYKDAIQSAQDNLNAYNDLGNNAIDSAMSLWRQKDRAQNQLVDDLWYYNTQKNINAMLQQKNEMNNTQGSIFKSFNDLWRLTDDQLDQTNTSNLKQGMFQNALEAKNSIDTTRTNMYENQLQTASQIEDILNQARAYAVNTGADFATNMASMNGGELVDKNGNYTAAGKEWIANILGLSLDGNNALQFDNNKVWDNSELSIQDMLANLRSNKPQLLTIDNLPVIRKATENAQYLRGQAGRNRIEGAKAATMSADQKNVANNVKRYG